MKLGILEKIKISVNKCKFWDNTTMILLSCTIVLPVILIFFSFYYNMIGYGITLGISLLAVFITILSTLYTNYNNKIQHKQQLLFDKRLKTYSDFADDLYVIRNKITLFKFLDSGNNLLLDLGDVKEIYEFIKNFKISIKYYYCSDDFKEVLDDFINFVDDNKLLDRCDLFQKKTITYKIDIFTNEISFGHLDDDENSRAMEILFKFKHVFENETNI